MSYIAICDYVSETRRLGGLGVAPYICVRVVCDVTQDSLNTHSIYIYIPYASVLKPQVITPSVGMQIVIIIMSSDCIAIYGERYV